MSIISRTAQYAVRAMALLSAQEHRMTVKDLAQAVGAPQPYLARIIMTLADTGMVDARRGPGGGLKLGRDPQQITLMEIVACFDGNALFADCALGLPGCQSSSVKCPVHEQWDHIREEIRSWWSQTTLANFSPDHICECLNSRVPSIHEAEGNGHEAGSGSGVWR